MVASKISSIFVCFSFYFHQNESLRIKLHLSYFCQTKTQNYQKASLQHSYNQIKLWKISKWFDLSSILKLQKHKGFIQS